MTNLERVMRELHDSEINAGVQTYYDAGMRAWIGDTFNGIRAETLIERTSHQWSAALTAASWLHGAALRLYPNSKYAKASAISSKRPSARLLPADVRGHSRARHTPLA
jgi:hypothetical protein